MRVLVEGAAARSAGEWRLFWEARGTRELRDVVLGAWPPLAAAGADARAACVFRIAALLGSRASAQALADELGRIRRGLGAEPAAIEDARASKAIAAWFEQAAP
ncbi:MAG TPA: hypothetical protein VLD16_14065 [Gaiellaceae bacterium]|nr:hypothetical protein [Gaiellaceae bacterium]